MLSSEIFLYFWKNTFLIKHNVCLSVSLSISLSVCLSVRLICLSVCLSVGRSVGWSLQIKNVFRRFMSSLFSSQESRQLNKTHCICEKKSKKLKKKAENVLIGFVFLLTFHSSLRFNFILSFFFPFFLPLISFWGGRIAPKNLVGTRASFAPSPPLNAPLLMPPP